MAFGNPTDTVEAHRLKIRAQQRRSSTTAFQSYSRAEEAEAAEEAVDQFLALPSLPPVGTGGELLPIGTNAVALPGVIDTVKNPNAVTQSASLQRIDLAEGAGVFDLAFDMAETIQAQNSIEKSLAHQMAAAHTHAMKLFAEAERQRIPVERARLTNAAARLMNAFQDSALTIDKLRGGGQQKVTVVHQHVQVAGGQVAVTGSMERKVGDESK